VPQSGGSLADLWTFVNLPEPDCRRLFLAWLMTALRGRGPFPILVISGEHGSGKTALPRVARLLVDPHEVIDQSLPQSLRDLMIAATNCWFLSFDNISYLPDWLSDALCRISTGAAFSTRELYTDADAALFKAKRAIVLNGIPDVASQGDLLDRSVLLHLPPIPADRRRDEQSLWTAFAARRPALLGALLDLMVAALRIEPTVVLEEHPRMADFALWGEAVCRAGGEKPGTFLKSYRANSEEAARIVLESSTMAGLVMGLMRK
jgi:hypothetical protein